MQLTQEQADRLRSSYIEEPNSGCWLWIGAALKTGYGRIRIHYKEYKAHRLTYELYKGPIPHGLVLDHLCRTPGCCNPDHLEPVTNKENARRGLYGVLKTHCAKGHPLSGPNLLRWRNLRLCRECRSRKYANWANKNRAHLAARQRAWRMAHHGRASDE